MNFRLDPWPIDTLDGQLALKPFAGDIHDIEQPRWEAVAPRPIPRELGRVLVIDGKPRMEARLLLDDGAGPPSVAGFGAYVAGAVDMCPHGTRPAELLSVRAQRILAYSSDLKERLDAATLSPRNPQTGELEYMPLSFAGQQLEGPRAAVQSAMLSAEHALARSLAPAIPDTQDLEEYDEGSAALHVPDALVLKDGRVDLGRGGVAIVGCIKTLHTDYLGADRGELLRRLQVGERTPILRFDLPNGKESRFTWYVRLSKAPFYQHPMAGVMRLEMHATDEADFLPKSVRAIAGLSGTLLTRLAGSPYKDSRAPQNLIPTAALEQTMGRAMGSLDIVTRRIRAHIVGLNL